MENKQTKRKLATSSHCANGHSWDEVGFYLRKAPGYPNGVRKVCRMCMKLAQQKNKGRELTPDIPVALPNGQKTHCPQGHPFDGKNTRIKQNGSRGCKICHRNNMMMRTYGITMEQFSALIIEQCGRCAICLEELPEPHVDHIHETGEVRGLLCNNCNNGLGRFRDNVDYLRNAIIYLD